ncbi:MAG: EamA family transporter [Treponemataceae bacterium]
MISHKSSAEIVVIKGTFSGLGSLIVALLKGEALPAFYWIAVVLLLGFVSFGLSINLYIMAQKDLGAAKTSAYYSIAPFLGVAFSMLLLGERPSIQFYIALAIIILSTFFMVKDTIELQHTHAHEHKHTHEHSHLGFVHTHEHIHMHTHLHTHSEYNENHNHSHTNAFPVHIHNH